MNLRSVGSMLVFLSLGSSAYCQMPQLAYREYALPSSQYQPGCFEYMMYIVDPLLDSIGIRNDSSFSRFDTTLIWPHATKAKSKQKPESKLRRESDSILYNEDTILTQKVEWRLGSCDTNTYARSLPYCMTVLHFDSVVFQFWHDAVEGPYLRIGQEGWVLECMRVRLPEDSLAPARTMRPFTVFVKGVDLNRRNLYWETFEYHHIDGRPFYFFRNATGLGYHYGDVAEQLFFDDIFHAGCCENSVSNPRFWENGCYFLAKRKETWYVVTLIQWKL